MNSLFHDLRHSFRLLRRSPGFAVAVVLILGLGIGSSATIFTFVSNLMFRPLAIEDAGRIVQIFERLPGDPRNQRASFRNFLDWREQNDVFDQLAAFRFEAPAFAGEGEAERISALKASHSIFPLLQAHVGVGRAFGEADDRPGAEPVAILSRGFFRARFGGDPNVIGRTIRLEGVPTTIVGVLAADPAYFGEADLWIPLSGNPAGPRSSHVLSVVGRLREGIGIDRAQSAMDVIARRLTDNIISNQQLTVFVAGFHESLLAPVRPALLVVMAAAIFLLLIACANVANLVLARGLGRTREIAIRSSLGASRRRLVGQLTIESIVLSLLGGAIGLFIAYRAIDPLVALIPENNRIVEIVFDLRVVAFAVGASIVTGLIFGLVPALKVTTPARFSRRHWMRNVFITSEIALALVLLAGAGLLVKSYDRVQRVDSGLNIRNVLTMRLSLPAASYSRDADIVRFYREALDEVRSLPAVESAAAAIQIPLGPSQMTPFAVEGRAEDAAADRSRLANSQSITPDYFRVMGIPLRGRSFDSRDVQGAAPAAIINETLARRYWPGEDAIGRRLRIGPPEWGLPWMSVVGVVGDVRAWGLEQEAPFEIYTPFDQTPSRFAAIVVRTTGAPADAAAALRSRILAVDPDQPVVAMRTMEEIVDESLWQRRITVMLMIVFAAVALMLSSIGLYGVIAYSVNQRQGEIGVRVALGAGRGDILKLAVGEGMKLAVIGLVLGLIATAGLTQAMSRLLFGVTPTDPATFITISIVLLAIAFLASYVPARRAARVDPATVLRAPSL